MSDRRCSAVSKIRFRDPQIEMAHGAGGKASRRLVEGLFAPLLFARLPSRWATPRTLTIDGDARRHHHRQLRGQAAALSRAAPSANWR